MLTVPQAADELGIDASQLYRYVQMRLIACVQYPSRNGSSGGPIRIDPAEVDAFKKRYQQQAAT